MKQNQDKTHFGFQTVNRSEKAGLVRGVFSNVATKYDVMNDIMSLGIHRLWKEALMDWLAPRAGQHLLDMAGGTGDISFKFLRRAGEGARSCVVDLTEEMLLEGQRRSENASFGSNIDWVVGDGMALPFEEGRFDRYVCSFGMRNITDIEAALCEAFRVLKIGGRLMVLEFSQLPNAALQWAYDRYSFNVIPQMGQLVVGDRDSYQYLVESIRRFPDQERFCALIEKAGFENVTYRNFSAGIVALHSGWKL